MRHLGIPATSRLVLQAAASIRCVSIAKETLMTMLTNFPRDPAPSIRTGIGALLALFCNFVNGRVAAALARRERQAELAVQRYLDSREPIRYGEPSEVGVYRYQIGDSPANTAESRRTDPSDLG
jgi:hypothetical protein